MQLYALGNTKWAWRTTLSLLWIMKIITYLPDSFRKKQFSQAEHRCLCLLLTHMSPQCQASSHIAPIKQPQWFPFPGRWEFSGGDLCCTAHPFQTLIQPCKQCLAHSPKEHVPFWLAIYLFNKHILYFFCARQCSKQFTNTNSCNLHDNPRR